MNDYVSILATALLWGAFGAVLAWLLTWPFRKRGWTGGHISIAVVATFAAVAAILGNSRAMLISTNDGNATVVAAVIAGLLASIAALASARTFRRDSTFLHTDIAAINDGEIPPEGAEPMSRDLRELHHAMRAMAQNLQDSRRREQALEAARRELVTWISHDLRTPLAGLRAMAEALQDEVATDPARYHAQIVVEVQRLTEMVDDLFQLSRLHVGVGVRRNERIDLSDLLSDTISSLEPIAREGRVKLTGSASISAEVMGDVSQLSRALTNLIYNAIRHTTEDGTVSVQLMAGDRPDRAVLRVADECGGVDPCDVPRLFEVGYRGRQDRAPHPGLGSGAGLGLSITREIVDAHDGGIDFENTGGGCAFTIVLPLAS